jgi:NitT/TauT family transport system permease protein
VIDPLIGRLAGRGPRRVPLGRVVPGVVGILGLAGVGEFAGRGGLIDAGLLPLPSTVLARAAGLTGNTQFLDDVRATLTAWVVGLAVAVAVAVPAGMALGVLRPFEITVFPVMELLRPIPSVALIPLFLLIIRDDLGTKVAVVTYAAAWPVLINTIYGLRDVDPLAKETLRSFGFGSISVLWRVLVPGSAPFIATGIRLAASVALVVAVGAELLGNSASGGIGVFIVQAGSGDGHLDLMIAATIWTGIIGLAVNAALAWIDRRLFGWHHSLTAGLS